MAALGSEVQSTSTELVSIIEEMKDQRRQLDIHIKAEEEEKTRLLREMKALEARIKLVDESLAVKHRARSELDRTISDTSDAFKNIVEASRKLLNSAREESTQLQLSCGSGSGRKR